jgi:hypothetical protein
MTTVQIDAQMVHKQDGFMIYEKCPNCNSRLMENAVGNRWCTNLACNFHIRDGKQAVYPKTVVFAD